MSFAEIPGGSLNRLSCPRKDQIAKSVCQPWVGVAPYLTRAPSKKIEHDSKTWWPGHPSTLASSSCFQGLQCLRERKRLVRSAGKIDERFAQLFVLGVHQPTKKRLRIAKAKQQRKAASV